MLDLKNNYRNISQKNRNSLRMFLESFYEPDEKTLTKSSDLMPDYNQWVKNTLNESSNVITSYQELKRQMEDLAFAKYSNTNAQKGYFMKRKVSTD